MLRAGGRNTFLDTTVLVHESFLRFLQAGRLNGSDRGQFFAYAGRIMRSVVVDFARKRQAERRGGELERVALDTQLAEDLRASDEQMLRINEALQALRKSTEAGAGRGDALFRRHDGNGDRAARWASRSALCGATGRRPSCCCWPACVKLPQRGRSCACWQRV